MASRETPKLQEPGAGLPWGELLVARHLVFPLTCRLQSWQSASSQFQKEGQRVLRVWDSTAPARRTERVLVRRFPGMEDSSRFWSVAMTVEHLTMVGRAIQGVIGALRRGLVPPGEPRTADFKPRGEKTIDVVHAEFVSLLQDAKTAEPPVPRGSGPRFSHPWFGPLDAHRWHGLLAFHQGLHRKQAEAISKELAVSRVR